MYFISESLLTPVGMCVQWIFADSFEKTNWNGIASGWIFFCNF